MFWNPEVITTTGKSLRITQIQFNIIYIMRTNINQGRIQSLAVMIVLLINNDQNPISYLIPYSRLNRSCNLNTLVSTTSYPLYGINAAISAIADKKEDLKSRLKSAILSRMHLRHAAYTVYQLYFTPSMP